jgi:hypothetical protein
MQAHRVVIEVVCARQQEAAISSGCPCSGVRRVDAHDGHTATLQLLDCRQARPAEADHDGVRVHVTAQCR